MDELYSVIDPDGSQRHQQPEAQLRADFQAGRIQGETLVWRPGLEQWAALKDLLPIGTWAAPAPRIELALDPHPEPAPKSEPAIQLEAAPARPAAAQPQLSAPQPAFRNPYQSPGSRLSESTDPELGYRIWGLRIAGALICVNILVSLFSMAGGKGSGNPMSIGPLIFDLILGPMLLMAKDSVRKWVLLRSTLGLLLWPVILLATGQGGVLVWVQIAINTLYCGGIILLVMGETLGLLRLILGSLMGAVIFLLALVGVASQTLLHKPLSRQTATDCHLSVLAFQPFKPSPGVSKDPVHFEQMSEMVSTSNQGSVIASYFQIRPGVRLDADVVTRKAFEAWVTRIGHPEAAEQGHAADHGSERGLECQATVSIAGAELSVRAFGFTEGDKTWVLLVASPANAAQEESATRILDSVQVDAN